MPSSLPVLRAAFNAVGDPCAASPAPREGRDDRKAQAGAGRSLPAAAAHEPLEHLLLLARLQPRALVRDGDDDLGAVVGGSA